MKKGVNRAGDFERKRKARKRELAFISLAFGVFAIVIVAGMFLQNGFSITGFVVEGQNAIGAGGNVSVNDSVGDLGRGNNGNGVGLGQEKNKSNEDAKAEFERERAKFKEDVKNRVVDVAGSEIGNSAKDYVEKFVGQRGIKPEKIKNVTKVDFNSLPGQIQFENINNANLAIYGINYDDGVENVSNDKEIFVVVYSLEELKNKGDIFFAGEKQQFLSFGSEGELSGNGGFLESASGVQGSVGVGYVMLRGGSITGLSTNLKVVNESSGEMVDVIVYKNGEPMSFGNSLDASSSGVKKDLDVQSSGTVEFEAGDVISVYVSSASGEEGVASWKDVITIVEISFE